MRGLGRGYVRTLLRTGQEEYWSGGDQEEALINKGLGRDSVMKGSGGNQEEALSGGDQEKGQAGGD